MTTMKYYKIVDEDKVIAIFQAKTEDDYFSAYDEKKETEKIIEINKIEFQNLLSTTDAEDQEQISFVYSSDKGYTTLEKKIMIFNTFANAGVLPTIEDLNNYYDWLIKE